LDFFFGRASGSTRWPTGGDPDALLLYAAEAATRAAWTIKGAFVLGWRLVMMIRTIWK
jgi:hypothetical protein